MSGVRGTVSKALLLSSVANMVRCAGLGMLRPSCMCCVSVVRSAMVEWWALKPCCVGERENVWCDVCENKPLEFIEVVV